jgi:hypothetical protein
MNKWIVAVGVVWAASIASAVLLTYELNRPLDYSIAARATAYAAPEMNAGRVVDERVDTAGQAVLMLPEVTIVASRHGVAEMQGTDDLVVDPTP